jgi:hypothetical protein
MKKLIFFLGPTNVGKTTLIEYCIKEYKAHGVFVGRILRQKYGEDFFKGQAAPEHTKIESLEIMSNGINEGINLNKELILVDGQPRSDDQLNYIIINYLDHQLKDLEVNFLLLHCSDSIRKRRMEDRDTEPEKRKLAEQRFYGDLPQVYKLTHDLITFGCRNIIYPIDSENSFYEFDCWLKQQKSECDLINDILREGKY